jgi:hypothetical protein
MSDKMGHTSGAEQVPEKASPCTGCKHAGEFLSHARQQAIFGVLQHPAGRRCEIRSAIPIYSALGQDSENVLDISKRRANTEVEYLFIAAALLGWGPLLTHRISTWDS